ncbi:ATP synthase regulation protein NCA2-domain-containing protein [Lentinula detonsa]|uniref:ATP synthase regulation protein NCA2-domain-containing protein n=1 Tax=Lentinula detonsa TaxID=2804962 RepID=A0AA38PTL7_9AGAR|nr:ATP synthase regulation protein NCA2-domain-containing protein [Lentinula detonsa]
MAPSPSFVRDFVKPLTSHPHVKFDPKHALARLQELRGDEEQSRVAGLAQQTQDERHEEEDELTRQILVSVYAQFLEGTLSQALEAETEAEWWSDVERTRWRVFWYLIQTLPSRVSNLLQTTTKAAENIRWSTPRPEVIFTSFFPHLIQRRYLYRSETFQKLRLPGPSFNIRKELVQSIRNFLQTIHKMLLVPLHYTLQEVSLKKLELLRIRDDRARTIGSLVLLRPEVQKFLESKVSLPDNEPGQLMHLTRDLLLAVNPESVQDEHNASDFTLFRLSTLANLSQRNSLQLHTLGLSRPSRLTRLWPRLVFGPPLLLYSTYYLYSSRGTLLNFVYDAKDVFNGFIVDWCVKPLAGVLDTVKTSKSDQAGWLVTKEGVQADYDSLERMARSLASDHLRYTPSQLDELSARIRLGDLTPVLKLYEEDIKSPFKSAVGGTLLRTVFIQVQKAKVDLDQALSGIDRLMKSQELTFAFVGLSPAMAIVYVVGGYLRRIIWPSDHDKGKYGGSKARERVFWAMRRVERLLVLDQSSSRDAVANNLNANGASSTHPSALTTGLLILSLTQLRTYAERHLPSSSTPQDHGSSSTVAVPSGSNIGSTAAATTSSSNLLTFSATSLREAFLEDLSDLQDPELGVDQKRMIVERMWRCWGETVFGRAK